MEQVTTLTQQPDRLTGTRSETQALLGDILSDGECSSYTAISQSALLPPRVSPASEHAPQELTTPPAPQEEGASKFMANGISIAGFQHLTNNICSDVHSDLDHWDNFYKQLKDVEALVCNNDRRVQYIWT